MTIRQLIEKIKEISLTKPNINYVGVGNVYDLNTTPDAEYSVVYITQGTSSVYETYTTHSLTLFYIDRLTDNFDNRLEIQSNGVKELTNIINTLVNVEDVEVSYPLTFTYFNQRFADDCAGVFTQIALSVDNDFGTCDYE